jgi:hypothetical protein
VIGGRTRPWGTSRDPRPEATRTRPRPGTGPSPLRTGVRADRSGWHRRRDCTSAHQGPGLRAEWRRSGRSWTPGSDRHERSPHPVEWLVEAKARPIGARSHRLTRQRDPIGRPPSTPSCVSRVVTWPRRPSEHASEPPPTTPNRTRRSPGSGSDRNAPTLQGTRVQAHTGAPGSGNRPPRPATGWPGRAQSRRCLTGWRCLGLAHAARPADRVIWGCPIRRSHTTDEARATVWPSTPPVSPRTLPRGSGIRARVVADSWARDSIARSVSLGEWVVHRQWDRRRRGVVWDKWTPWGGFAVLAGYGTGSDRWRGADGIRLESVSIDRLLTNEPALSERARTRTQPILDDAPMTIDRQASVPAGLARARQPQGRWGPANGPRWDWAITSSAHSHAALTALAERLRLGPGAARTGGAVLIGRVGRSPGAIPEPNRVGRGRWQRVSGPARGGRGARGRRLA